MKYGVGVAMIGDQYVLVATGGSEGGAARVVSVQFVDRFDKDVDFIGTYSRKGVKRLEGKDMTSLGGADALP